MCMCNSDLFLWSECFKIFKEHDIYYVIQKVFSQSVQNIEQWNGEVSHKTQKMTQSYITAAVLHEWHFEQ